MVASPGFDLHAARVTYWSFHWGLPPGRVLRVRGPRGVPHAVAQLGALVALELDGGYWVWPRGRVHLATGRFGRELYLVAAGGCVPGEGWRAGRVVAVRYRTNKGDGAAVWRHAFEGTRPRLELDRDGFPVIRRSGSGFRVTWRGIVG